MFGLVSSFVFGQIFEVFDFLFGIVHFNFLLFEAVFCCFHQNVGKIQHHCVSGCCGRSHLELLLASLVLLTFLDVSLESCDQPGLDEPHF